ncbi:MAG: enoyl-CoA hydratase [Pseudomonadota bacterium]
MSNDTTAKEHDAQAPGLIGTLEDGILWITISNPARRNAMTKAMWRDMPTLLERAESDDAVRVIVLRGGSEVAFCAGADISEFKEERTGAVGAAYEELNHRCFGTLSRCAKPTIAMVQGFCLGGGLELALCCDLRVASPEAQFGIPAAKLGIGYNPRWIRPLLASMTIARAKELLFTGRRFGANAAYDMGILNAIHEADALHAATLALAGEIAANAPLSVLAAKKTLDEFQDHPENPDLAMLDRYVERAMQSADYDEGQRAFLEKRVPVFKGH